MNRIPLLLAALLFAAGLVTGMVAQRLLSTPAVEPLADAMQPAATVADNTDGAPASAPRERRDAYPEDAEQAAAPEAREEWMSTFAMPMEESPRETDGARDEAPWGRGAWTNREAWLEQRRIEREEQVNRMRSNLVERAGLSDDQTVRFDVLVTAMNLRLQQQTRLWQEALESGLMSRAEIRARAMKEVGTAVTLTYDELDRNLPPEWRSDTTNEAVNLWTFIEPETWRAMRPLMGGRGRPNRPR